MLHNDYAQEARHFGALLLIGLIVLGFLEYLYSHGTSGAVIISVAYSVGMYIYAGWLVYVGWPLTMQRFLR